MCVRKIHNVIVNLLLKVLGSHSGRMPRGVKRDSVGHLEKEDLNPLAETKGQIIKHFLLNLRTFFELIIQ